MKACAKYVEQCAQKFTKFHTYPQLKCKELKKCRVIVISYNKFKCLWVRCRFLTLNEPFLVENRLTLRTMYDLL